MTEEKKVNLTQKEYEELINDRKSIQKVRDRQSYYTRKRNAVLMIYKSKAQKMGIKEPTEQEINDYLKKNE